MIFIELHKALFKLIIKVDIDIFFFERILAEIIKFLLLGGERMIIINTILSILLYIIIEFLLIIFEDLAYIISLRF